jgi:flagellar hook protein FlgE
MFDTIFIGTSGLISHSKGLRIVGNNLANVNTPGFKSAQSVFSDLFEQGGGAAQNQLGNASSYAVGTGVTTLGSKINFNAGLDQSTGNALDLNINGNGFYAIKRDDAILYTRAGDFRFDDDGILVNSAGDHVLGLAEGGVLTDITSKNADRSAPRATGAITVQGNLSTTITTPVTNASVSNLTVYDADGINHPVNLSFVNNGSGLFTVTATEVGAAAGVTLGSKQLKFTGGFPVAGSDKLSFKYAPAGATPFDVTIDFSKGVTALATANTIAAGTQDGYTAGVQTAQTIDADGNVVMHYSNGQSANVARVALANFASDTDLEQLPGAAFALKPGAVAHYGFANAGGFGTLVAGHREGSNVDLAEEFSNLILMQRGYQASSHVISTANDMIQELFDMKGHG